MSVPRPKWDINVPRRHARSAAHSGRVGLPPPRITGVQGETEYEPVDARVLAEKRLRKDVRPLKRFPSRRSVLSLARPSLISDLRCESR
jgi:hypothetical protein